MPLIIPFKDLPAFKETISLDGDLYVFEFDYNATFDYWTFSVRSKAGVLLLSGSKIVLGQELLQQYGSRGLPPGKLFAIDTTETASNIGRNDLNGSVQLVYIPASEVD